MTPLFSVVIGIAIFIAVEAFFVASEMALMQASRVSLETDAEEGDRGAQLALGLLSDEATLLGTCHVGINLSVVSWSALATSIGLGESESGAGALVVLPLALVFGQALPKTVAAHHANTLAPLLAWPLTLVRDLLRPILLIVEGWSRMLRWMFKPPVEPELTREELLDLLETEHQGPIEEANRKVIRGILELSDCAVTDCMTPLVKVIAVQDTDTVARAAQVAVRTRHSRLAVYEGRIDRIVGVVHQTDLLFLEADDDPIAAHQRPVRYIPEFKRADALFREMRTSGEHFGVVVDEYGGCIGIVTLEDLLEQLVGDIEDERTNAPRQIAEVSPGLWVAPASVEVEAFAEALDVEVPDGPWLSLGGFLCARHGRVPEVGATWDELGLRFTVTRAVPRAVQEIRISRLDGPSPSTSAGRP
jgi:CBS domain containing-hemolysin-like protein